MVVGIATVIMSSVVAAAPHYGVAWDWRNTPKNCLLIGDVEPNGAMADAGLRAGDCLQPADGDDELFEALRSVSAGETLQLRRSDGGVVSVVPTDCRTASFPFFVTLVTDDDVPVEPAATRDTDLFALMRRNHVDDPTSCVAKFGGHFSREQIVPIKTGLTGRNAGCFTAVRINCGTSTRTEAWMQFSTGAVIGILLKKGQLPPPEYLCVQRRKEPNWFDCKTVLERKARDAGVSP